MSADLTMGERGDAALAFESAAMSARTARYWRTEKALCGTDAAGPHSAGICEANARRHEKRVREIALRSEIHLQRKARAAAIQNEDWQGHRGGCGRSLVDRTWIVWAGLGYAGPIRRAVVDDFGNLIPVGASL